MGGLFAFPLLQRSHFACSASCSPHFPPGPPPLGVLTSQGYDSHAHGSHRPFPGQARSLNRGCYGQDSRRAFFAGRILASSERCYQAQGGKYKTRGIGLEEATVFIGLPWRQFDRRELTRGIRYCRHSSHCHPGRPHF